jgi:hypothetical protein
VLVSLRPCTSARRDRRTKRFAREERPPLFEQQRASAKVPDWVKPGPRGAVATRPLSYWKQPSFEHRRRSQKCHYRKWAASFDHLVGEGEQGRRHGEAERHGGRQVDDELELWSAAPTGRSAGFSPLRMRST